MFSITEKCVLVAACMAAAIPVATAGTVTLAGEGVTIRYEDRAAGVLGAPSLIATSLIAAPASFAGVERAAAVAGPLAPVPGAVSVSALVREELPRSFAERAALRFALDDDGGRESGLYSLLIAGLGLFGLIIRQRLAAISRLPHSPAFQ